jgi:hypothetical protein
MVKDMSIANTTFRYISIVQAILRVLLTFTLQPGPRAKDVVDMTYTVHIPIEDPVTADAEQEHDGMVFEVVQEVDPHSGKMVDVIVLDVSTSTSWK